MPGFRALAASCRAPGTPAGISVEIAIAACEQARLGLHGGCAPLSPRSCRPSNGAGEADVAVTGPRLDAATPARCRAGRGPTSGIMGRLPPWPETSTLDTATGGRAGRPVAWAWAKDTVDARWLATYHASTPRITPFDDPAAGRRCAALEGGRRSMRPSATHLQVIYWVAGEAAADCCRRLGGAYLGLRLFQPQPGLRRPAETWPELAQALDYGTRQGADRRAATAKILRTYVPLDPWGERWPGRVAAGEAGERA